jgi:hypothetical protein
LDKAEAVAVLREIFTLCPELERSDYVSLDPDNGKKNSKGFYKIRLRVNLDNEEKNVIQPILDAHKLKITQNKDLVTICSQTV